MADIWTIRKVIDWTSKDFATRGVDSPRVDAELLVAESLGIDRVRIYMDLDRPLATDELAAIRTMVARRRSREPVAYILGRRDFYGATYAVDARVLIPRPDTEVLVERVLAAVPSDAAGTLLDLCTGSGAIPIAVLRARPSMRAIGSDVSTGALEVANENAKSLGVAERFSTVVGDLFEPIPPDARFEVITANPPYIRSADVAGLMPEVAAFEPRLALDGGDDGLRLYPALASGAAARLVDDGFFALEVGFGQAEAVAAMITTTDCFDAVTLVKDYGAIDRVVTARRRPR